MTNFERFQERNRKRTVATDKGNAAFIIGGYNSTTMSCGEISIPAAVVNLQEKETAYIYTKLENPLEIGSVWETKSLHFLIDEEIITIKDVEWHKYHAELCNVEIEGYWGRFITPDRINVKLQEEVDITSLQRPLIILPDGLLKFEDKIVIKNRPWLVQEIDNISVPGIAYYSLAPTTIGKANTMMRTAEPQKESYIVRAVENPYVVVDEHVDEEGINYIGSNINVTLSTEGGYFNYNNPAIKVIARSATQVIFCLPFGVDEVVVETRKDGEVVSATYRRVD